MKNMTGQMVIISMCFALMGCTSTHIKKLSGGEFQTRANEIEVMSSIGKMSYLGCSDKNAYLEFRRGSSTTVYWTELAALPENISQQLAEGHSPWMPWDQK